MGMGCMGTTWLEMSTGRFRLSSISSSTNKPAAQGAALGALTQRTRRKKKRGRGGEVYFDHRLRWEHCGTLWEHWVRLGLLHNVLNTPNLSRVRVQSIGLTLLVLPATDTRWKRLCLMRM